MFPFHLGFCLPQQRKHSECVCVRVHLFHDYFGKKYERDLISSQHFSVIHTIAIAIVGTEVDIARYLHRNAERWRDATSSFLIFYCGASRFCHSISQRYDCSCQINFSNVTNFSACNRDSKKNWITKLLVMCECVCVCVCIWWMGQFILCNVSEF